MPFIYTLHGSLLKNGNLVVYLVNMKQPFSIQVVFSKEREKVTLPIHGTLFSHTNYTIYKIEGDDIYNKKNEALVKNKLYQFSTLLLSHNIPLDTNVQMHITFDKDRCCCQRLFHKKPRQKHLSLSVMLFVKKLLNKTQHVDYLFTPSFFIKMLFLVVDFVVKIHIIQKLYVALPQQDCGSKQLI